jgi:hypothetical protein
LQRNNISTTTTSKQRKAKDWTKEENGKTKRIEMIMR